MKNAKRITIQMDRGVALRYNLLCCKNCGYPPNNHFDFPAEGHKIGDYGLGPSAHDDKCKAYVEVPRSGMTFFPEPR